MAVLFFQFGILDSALRSSTKWHNKIYKKNLDPLLKRKSIKIWDAKIFFNFVFLLKVFLHFLWKFDLLLLLFSIRDQRMVNYWVGTISIHIHFLWGGGRQKTNFGAFNDHFYKPSIIGECLFCGWNCTRRWYQKKAPNVQKKLCSTSLPS